LAAALTAAAFVAWTVIAAAPAVVPTDPRR
jgi:hypothetical protein